jgi:hypothetical protein
VPVLGVLRAKSPASAAFLRHIISSGAGLWSRDTTALLQRKLKKITWKAFAILGFTALNVSSTASVALFLISKSPDRWWRQATAHLKFSPCLEEIDYEYKDIATQGGELKGKKSGTESTTFDSARPRQIFHK